MATLETVLLKLSFGFQNILIPSLANIQEDSRGTPISSSNKTDCHDIHEIILLKVVLIIIQHARVKVRENCDFNPQKIYYICA
jgi:hypothetical protein